MRSTHAAGEEKPQNPLVAAKKILQKKSPESAEIIYQVTKDENAPKANVFSQQGTPRRCTVAPETPSRKIIPLGLH